PIHINTLDLAPIIPIILDNPIQASQNLHEPLINIPFIHNHQPLTFILINKSTHHIPKIHHFFQQPFSTKPHNPPLPLSTLKQLTHSNHNLLLHTLIQNPYFLQKVEINNNQS
ncbi:GHKL domain-containing protein, partial [Staphylococcus epidermidis]|uniref:GHKL domain-containing protein n=1 Tax=Staphylococcus epidermidis TaxID=1282 RepID=UPI0011A50353